MGERRATVYEKALLLLVAGVFVWSAIHPRDRLTWALEVMPVLVAAPIILLTWRRFPLTDLLYGLLAVHAIVLIVGGKYTYSQMPLFNWIKDAFHLARNNYDRFGHLMQGFVPAILARELLLRTSPLKRGKWMFALIVLSCLGASALYELVEWQAAVWLGGDAEAYLATQGDVWDTQKDMAMAGAGAILAQVTLARFHDRQLRPFLTECEAPK